METYFTQAQFGNIWADYYVDASSPEQAQVKARALFVKQFNLTAGQSGFVSVAV